MGNKSGGTVPIHVFDNLSHGRASLSDLGQKDFQKIEVPIINLDSYLESKGLNRIDFLKCDVEGSELAVLEGYRDLLIGPDVPVLFLELNEESSDAFGFESIDIMNYLLEMGYEHFFAIVTGTQL